MPHQNIIPAIDRLFRAYVGYLQDMSKDTLFMLLNALHSLDDRVEADHGRLFFGVPEYLTLKAIRNLEHHGVEVKYVVAPKGHLSDILFVCLISVAHRDAAIEGDKTKKQKYRDNDREAFEKTTLLYGDIVDINPCIFNCMVRIFEILRDLGLESETEEYLMLAESYEREEEDGLSHFVTGRIYAHARDVSEVIAWMQRTYEAG